MTQRWCDAETQTCSYSPSAFCWILFWRRCQAFSTLKIKNIHKNVMKPTYGACADGVTCLTCFWVTSGSHRVLSTTLACSTCLSFGHWLCSLRRASSVLTPSRRVILNTAWEEKANKRRMSRVELSSETTVAPSSGNIKKVTRKGHKI